MYEIGFQDMICEYEKELYNKQLLDIDIDIYHGDWEIVYSIYL